MNYNLLEEKWIPVLYHDGRTERVGICMAFEDAHLIRQIAAPNPMDRAAVLRFLLAILYWCKGNPPDKMPDGSFPSDWFKKLYENKGCFNLLGNERRFYQCKSDKVEKQLSANYLIQEIPTGINFWHFKHATEGKDGLCPSCCAMGLLRLPLFATSAGRGKSPGINEKPPIYTIPLGFSLANTLRLSWKNILNLGTPAWEKSDMPFPRKGKVPLLTGLTCSPRHVWLDDPENEANCISCGRKEPLIRRCVFAGIGSTSPDEGRDWKDPHVICGSNGVVLKSSNALAEDAAAGQWRRIMEGILGEQRTNVKMWIVSFATVQNDKYIEAKEYEVYLGSDDQKKIQKNIGKSWQSWLEKSKHLQKRKLWRSKAACKAAIASISPYVETEIFARVGELIEDNDKAWEYSRPMIAAIAESLFPGFTTTAAQRRKQFTETKPDMRQQTNTAKKGRKKGGGK